MLTVLAHLVFWPMVVWNLTLWGVIFFGAGNYKWSWKWRDIKDLVIAAVFLVVPGVYIFGIY